MTTLARRASEAPILDELRAVLSATGLGNLFNPSVLLGDEAHVAFRALGPSGTKPFSAFWTHRTTTGVWSTVDLSLHAAQWSIGPVADPKLFATSTGLYVTFNTGTPSSGPNDLYVMELLPTLGRPRPCHVEGRVRIEKNWAFYDSPHGLRALYGLRPLVVLATDDLDGAGGLTFRRAAAATHEHPGRDVSLGTQPVRAEDGALLMIGHEKFWWRGRRGYVGRPVIVSGADSETPHARPGGRRLLHSVRAALPRLGATHNPHLWSATYFAGLTPYDGRFVASYGVNDTGFGLAQIGGETWCG